MSKPGWRALFHVEGQTQCPAELLSEGRFNTPLYATLFSSAFMVFFFMRAGTESCIAQIDELLDSEHSRFHLVHERIPLTGVHLLVHLPLLGFCALTLSAPAFAFVHLRLIAIICQPA